MPATTPTEKLLKLPMLKPEQLKAKNPMLWIGRMNEIQARAREIVNAELIENESNITLIALKIRWVGIISYLPYFMLWKQFATNISDR